MRHDMWANSKQNLNRVKCIKKVCIPEHTDWSKAVNLLIKML